MPNLKSAKKRVRSDRTKRLQNDALRSQMKTLTKKTLSAIEEKNQDNVRTFLKQAFSYIDRSAKKGIVHKNSANRKKSRLAKLAESFVLESPASH